jgi:Trypsin-like peptidase domain
MRKRNVMVIAAVLAAVMIAAFVSMNLSIPGSNTVSMPESISTPGFKIADHAKKITVRVSGENRSGSGVLISRKETGNSNLPGYYYLVLTCYHNISLDSSAKSKIFHVFTPDNIVYSASPIKEKRLFPELDLDAIYFYSPLKLLYEVAVKPTKLDTIKFNDKLTVAGYPCQSEGCPDIGSLKIINGFANPIKKPLSKGYQLGFSEDFKEGTSGGAVINNNGQLVGIAGKRKGIYGVSNQQYTYADKSVPSSIEIDQYGKLSWAIPVNETILDTAIKLFQDASFSDINPQKENAELSKKIEYLTASYLDMKLLNIFIAVLLFFATISLMFLCLSAFIILKKMY